jgi:hypothetical protein
VYHLQISQFPHNVSRFNLDGRELRTILYPWVSERVFELGEHKWSPQEANLTVLEGPELPVQSLSMGRGWGAAERQGQDVTRSVLAQARQELSAQAQPQPGAASAPAGAAPAAAPQVDSLAAGVELASLLGPDAVRLLAAWREVAGRAAGLSPSETLALAERQLAGPTDGR